MYSREPPQTPTLPAWPLYRALASGGMSERSTAPASSKGAVIAAAGGVQEEGRASEGEGDDKIVGASKTFCKIFFSFF